MKTEHWVAIAGLIATFAAAVSGAWIGGTVANNGAKDLQKSAAARSEARDQRATQAAARVLVAELEGVSSAVVGATFGACWWPADYRVALTLADRKSLAERLSPRDWTAVSNALTASSQVAAEQQNGFAWRPGQESTDMEVAIYFLRRSQQAIDRLVAFARMDKPIELPATPSPRARDYAHNGHIVPRKWGPRTPLCRD